MNSASSTCHTCQSAILAADAGGLCPACILLDAMGGGNVGFAVAGFTIEGLLGAGGMGRVYRATQHSPNREVALKMLPPGHLLSPDLVQRFRNEAETVATLDHSAILPIYAVGEHDGMPFFTMKLAEGGTLGERKTQLHQDWPEIASIMAKISSAVQYAHQRGVLHRDLKPPNILFDATDQPCVSDFGLAKLALTEDGADALTQSMQMLGTPAYLAPELARSSLKAATTSSDIYALGAILYELITGQKPHDADSIPALLQKIIHEDPVPLLTRSAVIPRDLAAITHKCLEKNPAARYASAQILADDLTAYLDGQPISARVPGAWEKTKRWVRKRPAIAGLSAALILGAVASGTSLWMAWRESEVRRQEAVQHRDASEKLADFLGRRVTSLVTPQGRPEVTEEILREVGSYFANAGDRPDPAFLQRKLRFLRLNFFHNGEQGHAKLSLSSAQAAAKLAQEIYRLDPNFPDAKAQVLETQGELAVALADSGSEHKAVAMATEAVHSAERDGSTGAGAATLVSLLLSRGTIYHECSERSLAAADYARAADLCGPIHSYVGSEFTPDRIRMLQALALRTSPSIHAAAWLASLEKDAEKSPSHRRQALLAKTQLGKALASEGKHSEALTVLLDSVVGLDGLAALDSQNSLWQRDLAMAQWLAASSYMRLGEEASKRNEATASEDLYKLAEPLLNRTWQHFEKLTAEHPELARFQEDMHALARDRGDLAHKLKLEPNRLAWLQREFTILKTMTETNPDRWHNWIMLAESLRSYGAALREGGKRAEAAALGEAWKATSANTSDVARNGAEWLKAEANILLANAARDAGDLPTAAQLALTSIAQRRQGVLAGNGLARSLSGMAVANVALIKSTPDIAGKLAVMEAALSELETWPRALVTADWRNDWSFAVSTAVAAGAGTKEYYNRSLALLRRSLSVIFPPDAVLSATDEAAKLTMVKNLPPERNVSL